LISIQHRKIIAFHEIEVSLSTFGDIPEPTAIDEGYTTVA